MKRSCAFLLFSINLNGAVKISVKHGKTDDPIACVKCPPRIHIVKLTWWKSSWIQHNNATAWLRCHLVKILLTTLIEWLIDWLFIVYRLVREYFTHKTLDHCRWWAAKFRPTFLTYDLLARRGLYRATAVFTRGLNWHELIRGTAPFNRLLRQARVPGDLF